MEFHMMYLFVANCMLVLPTSLVLGLDANIDKNSQEAESEIRLLSRILEAKKEQMVAPKASEMELREEKETVKKMDDDRRSKIDVIVGNEPVEKHILDCKNRYEVIIMKESDRHKRPMTCNLREMDDILYSSACLRKETMPLNAFTTVDYVVGKDFLSQIGSDSVCRDLPMFNTVNVDDVNKDDTSSRRGLYVSKKTCTMCGMECYDRWNCYYECTEC